MMNLIASIKLRFFDQDALIAALDMLDRNKDASLDNDVRIAKLRIARELIRRGVVFW